MSNGISSSSYRYSLKIVVLMQLSFHLLFLRGKSEFNGRQICLHQKYIIYVTKVVFIFLFILYLKFQLIEIGGLQILMNHILY